MAKKGSGHRKGRWEFGRRVKNPGNPPTKHRRKSWWETPEDRAQKGSK